VRGTKQPTCAYRFSFWINPIGALRHANCITR
jgi:hypothetical protein